MANTYDEARVLLFTSLEGAWNTATTSAPLDKPNLGTFKPPEKAKWGRLFLNVFDTPQVALGGESTCYLASGIAGIQVFVPQGSGVKTAETIGQALVDALRAANKDGSLENVSLQNIRSRPIGPDGAWYMLTADAQFSFDQTD